MKRSSHLLTVFAVLALAVASMAAGAPADDAALNADPRFAAVPAQPGSGSGSEDGTYLPPLAGAGGEITGTVVADSGAGPTDFYVASVDDDGKMSYWKSSTDSNGRFHLRLPQGTTKLVSLLLFKHFDAQGRPDKGAATTIATGSSHLENSIAVTNVPSNGPAIVEARTSYERGGQERGLVPLHVRDVDPLSARVTLDGSDRAIDTLAASDVSILGKLHDDASLGRHAIAVRSSTGTTNAQTADVVALRFDPIGKLMPGEVVPVRLHVDGVGNDPARVTFTVSGSASIADGSPSATVPVADGVATTDIRGRQPGALVLRTQLDVAIPQQVAESTPTPQETLPPTATPKPTLKPTPTAKPKATKTPKPTPTPTPTPPPPVPPPPPPLPSNPAYPETPTPEPEIPLPYAPAPTVAEVPPCISRLVDGWFEPTQGVWQDDLAFVDLPGKQLTRANATVPSYVAEIPMIAERETVLAGVDHYRLAPPFSQSGAIIHVSTHVNGVTMVVETNCTQAIKGVHFHYLMVQNGSGRTFLQDSPPLRNIPTQGPPSSSMQKVIIVQNFADITQPPQHFRFSQPGPYSLYAVLQGPDNLPLFNGAQIEVDGTVVTTVAPRIAILPARLGPPESPQLASLDRAGGAHAANALKDALAARTSDYFPIQTGPIPVQVRSYRDLSGVQVPAYFGKRTLDLITGDWSVDLQSLVTALAQTVGTTSLLQGAQRTVILLDDNEFATILKEAVPGVTAGGFTPAPPAPTAISPIGKIVIAPRSISSIDTLHEIVHTLPAGWADAGMLAECKRNYHNVFQAIANGYQVSVDGVFSLHERDASIPIMGTSVGNESVSLLEKWITQCTYRHLADVLQKAPDPPGWIVRGYIYSKGGKSAGRLLPAVAFEGAIDPKTATTTTPWQIVVRNKAGAVLARYDIAPQWFDVHAKLQYRYLPVLLPIPRTASAAMIELYGPGGKYDSVSVPQ